MALAMSRPWRDPKTGLWYLRKRVPEDLRALVGRAVYKRSLGTKDAAEAKRRHVHALAELEGRWANLRAGPRRITEPEAHALAATFYDQWLASHRDFPSRQTFWDTKIGATLWSRRDEHASPSDIDLGMDVSPAYASVFRFSGHLRLEGWCKEQAASFLSEKGLPLTPDNRATMARAIGAATQRASLALEQDAQGMSASTAPTTSLAQVHPVQPQNQEQDRPSGRSERAEPKRESLTGLFEAWWQEAKGAGRKPSTHESYEKTVRYLVAFLKHDDAARVTPEDIVAFKDHRLATPSKRTGKVPSAKTVKDSDLAALKTLFGWAVNNRKLPANPAAGLTIKIGKRPKVRPQGFVEAEAHAILAAALHYVPGKREAPDTSAARHWVPWLCAFSGARVGEMGQLRRQDLRREGDMWVIHITPEAGRVKNNEARDVVLHPQLVELGFPAFVEASAEGPLFVTPGKGGDVLGPLDGLLNRMREFVRPIVSDPNVQPNHGWRHLFTTICEEVEINPRVYNAIMGHAGRTVAERYGDVTLKAKANAIRKLPPFDLDKLRAIVADREEARSAPKARLVPLPRILEVE